MKDAWEADSNFIRKVIFWLAPNEILIPADRQKSTRCQHALAAPGWDEEKGRPLNNPDAVVRLKKERKHASLLQSKVSRSARRRQFPDWRLE